MTVRVGIIGLGGILERGTVQIRGIADDERDAVRFFRLDPAATRPPRLSAPQAAQINRRTTKQPRRKSVPIPDILTKVSRLPA